MPHSPHCSDPSLPEPVQAQCGDSPGQQLPGAPVLTDTHFLLLSPISCKSSCGSQVIFLHHSPEKYREVFHALGQSEPWSSSSTGSVNPRTEHSDIYIYIPLSRCTCSRNRGSLHVPFKILPLTPCAAGGHSSWLTIQSPANLSVHTIC